MKADNRQTWERMGLELALLNELIAKIHCDREYNAVMDKATWDKLGRVEYHLSTLRSKCEERMAQKLPAWNTATFYPRDRDDICWTVDDLRKRMAEAAKMKAENIEQF